MTTPDTTRPDDADDLSSASPEEGREALTSGKADQGGSPPGHEETVMEGLGASIGNIVLGSLPDPGPRDGVARRDAPAPEEEDAPKKP